jgi:drug/metabolite transporter (DMT)-like permease
VLSAAAGVVCFSGTAVATRAAAPAFGAPTLTSARIAIAATLAIPTLVAIGPPRLPPRRLLGPLLTMGVGLAVGFPLLLAVAVERVPASHAAVVLGIAPAATAAVAAVRTRRRAPARFWGACAAGLVITLAFAVAQGGGTPRPADLWVAASVLSVAVGYVEGGRIAREVGGTRALCWALLLLAPLAAAGLAVADHGAADKTRDAWLGLAYAGVFSMFIGSVLWYRGLASGGVARIGQLNLAQPLLAIAWSGLLLHERVGWTVPVTAVAILATLVVSLRATGGEPVRGSPSTQGGLT